MNGAVGHVNRSVFDFLSAAPIFRNMKQTACLLGIGWMMVCIAPSIARAQCRGDFDGDGMVTVNEIIISVNNALNGCQGSGQRFGDNGDGTVTDHTTGLVWEKKESLDGTADPINPHDADNTYAWTTGPPWPADGAAFTDFLQKLNACVSADGSALTGGFAGHCDWRLPTIAELRTILLAPSPCGTSPCIDPIFGPTQAYCYWSATTFANHPDDAWDVNFNIGDVEFNNYKILGLFVRAVRGGR